MKSLLTPPLLSRIIASLEHERDVTCINYASMTLYAFILNEYIINGVRQLNVYIGVRAGLWGGGGGGGGGGDPVRAGAVHLIFQISELAMVFANDEQT